jgi:tungstate transport system ATP-binding protein
MSAFELDGVTKGYGGRTVLRVPRLSVGAGRTLAVVGPSGAGKSTLLRLLNFLEAPDAGELRYAGELVPPTGPPAEARRAVTTVFQRPLLLDANVWDNVAYGLRIRGCYSREPVARAIERVGLAHLARAHGRTLSGGEQQRVALARALVFGPRVLLLDEPTANLDPENVAIIEAIVREQRAAGTTVVIVTHNLFQARRLADDAALLIGGELVESGPAAALFEAPRDPRAAAFVDGRMVY